MSILRPIYRIAALVLWSMIVAVLTIPSQMRSGWKGVKKIAYFTRLWTIGLARIIGLKVIISGEIPKKTGGLVVSNHTSYIDIITHGSVLPLRYSPKSDIFKWPILGWYIGISRPIWTDRRSKKVSKKALREFTKTMKHGMYLIVYPEGTTTDGKSGVLPFKSTPFEAAITGKSPIIPVITRYKQARGETPVAWYGDMTLLPHVWQMLKLPSIEAHVKFLPPILPGEKDRKELASYVHSIIAREYSKN